MNAASARIFARHGACLLAILLLSLAIGGFTLGFTKVRLGSRERPDAPLARQIAARAIAGGAMGVFSVFSLGRIPAGNGSRINTWPHSGPILAIGLIAYALLSMAHSPCPEAKCGPEPRNEPMEPLP